MQKVSKFLLMLAALSARSFAALINGDFSSPLVGSQPFVEEFAVGQIYAYAQVDVLGWSTTDSKGAIEIWKSGAMGFQGYSVYSQWAELNAYSAGTLSQTVSGISVNSQFGLSFAHRGRGSATVADVMRVRVVDLGGNNAADGGDDSLLFVDDFATTNEAWQFYEVDLGTKANLNNVLLQFEAISTGSGNISVGNFVTAIELNNGIVNLVGTANVPEPITFVLVGAALLGLMLRQWTKPEPPKV